MEKFDELVKRILNAATKSVEGIKCNTPHSKEKEKQGAAVMHWKVEIRKMKGIVVDD